MPGVEFGRVNRRTLDQSLDPRPFSVDMEALAESGETTATIGDTTYIAADLQVVPSGTFMTGLIGFAEQDTVRRFEQDAFSWMKGEVSDFEGATSKTVVPFAIDLRPHHRWVAHAVSYRIRSSLFRRALAATLNNAVSALGLLPSEWELDPVLSVSTVEDWIGSNPEVVSFTRAVKVTNALKDVDDARRKMRLLGAQKMTDSWTAGRGESLEVRHNPEFEEMIAGVETGDVEVKISARGGKGIIKFSSSDHVDRVEIVPYGADLERGVELVLDALRAFSDRRGAVLSQDGDPADEAAPDPASLNGPYPLREADRDG